MALPSKRKIGQKETPQAQRQFTDRTEPQESFKKALAKVEEQDYNILTYYGVGGIGKTSLQNYLKSEHLDKDPEALYTYLNFEDAKHRLPYTAFRQLTKNFNKKIPFTSFDIAYTIYWSKAFPESDLKKAKLPFMEEGNLLSSAVGLLADTAAVSVGLGLISYASDKLAEVSFSSDIRAELEELDTLDINEVESRLGIFFAYDIDNYKKKNPSTKVVVFLDTYEALWQTNKTDANIYKQDEWIRNDLIAQLQNVLFVICGREKIIWAEYEPDWKEILNQHILGRLSDNDSRDFLESCDIKDSLIQDEIIKSSKGYPFYLDLCVDTYMEIKKSGIQPTAEYFKEINKEEIFERFMRYLSEDTITTNMLYTLSHARFYTKEIFKILLGIKYSNSDMQRLNNYSFIKEDEDGVFYIHNLMRESLIESNMNAEGEEANTLLFEYYESQLQDLDIKNISQVSIDALPETFYHKEKISDINALDDWYMEAYYKFRKAAKHKELFETSLVLKELKEEALGEGHPDTAISYNNLAGLYENIGSYEEALPLYGEALKIFEEVFGENHPSTATSYNNLAGLYQHMGSYEEALSLYKKSRKIREEVLGENHPDTATSYNNLAGLYENMGSYEEALSLYEKALKTREEIFGKNHLDTAASYNALAGLYHGMGSYEEALSLYEKALKVKEEVLGEGHPDTAISYNNLAGLYQSMGSYEEALPLYGEALKIFEEVFGENHPDTATSYNNLAGLYQNMGSYEEALSLYKKSRKVREEVLGENHPDTATSYNDLAGLYVSMDSYEEALPLYEKALKIREEVIGEDHLDTAISYNDLAGLYHSMGSYEEALSLYEKSHKIKEEVLGEDHPDTAISYNNLAGLYQSMGSYEEALPLYGEALKIFEEVFGENHPSTATSYSNLAGLYQNMGSYEEALSLYKKSRKVREEVLGKDHPSTVACYNNLAFLYEIMDRYEEALPLYEKVRKGREEALSGDNQ